MKKVIAQEFMSIDGVVQGPSSADEDPTGGFSHGGWHVPYLDDVAMRWVIVNVSSAWAYLLGRRTYEIFASHWPNAPADEQVLARPLNTKPKYVASTTLVEPLSWQNSRLLHGNIAEAVNVLKQNDGGDILVIGSTKLVQNLVAHNIVDEFRLMIDPLVLGGGKRVFRDDGVLRRFLLADAHATPLGAILATYMAGQLSGLSDPSAKV